MTDDSTPDEDRDGGAARRPAGRHKRNRVSWILTVIGAVVPGLWPVTFFLLLGLGLGQVSYLPMYAWAAVGGPLLGASVGALVGLRCGSPAERAVRRVILGGGVGMLLSVVAFVSRLHLPLGMEVRIPPGFVAMGLLVGVLLARSQFRLRTLIITTGLVAVLMAWMTVPFRPDPRMKKCQEALRGIGERTADDPALRPKSEPEPVVVPRSSGTKGRGSQHMSLSYITTDTAPHDRSVAGQVEVTISTAWSPHWRKAGHETADSGNASQWYDERTYWNSFKGRRFGRDHGRNWSRLTIGVHSTSSDPDAHRRLLAIVRDELKSQGIVIAVNKKGSDPSNASSSRTVKKKKKSRGSSH